MNIQSSRDRLQLGRSAELATSPRIVVELGTAPDGLPWLLQVDRSHELATLFQVVPQVFGLTHREDLPARVRDALERDVAAGLMGVHEVAIEGRGVRGFVSRRKLKRLLGATLFAQLLEPSAAAHVERDGIGASTNVGAMASREDDDALLDAVERSIDALRSKRHLLVDIASAQAYSCGVRDTDRALRVPSAPVRPLAFETLSVLAGVEVLLQAPTGSWAVPLGERSALHAALLRIHQGKHGGSVRYSIPRHQLLAQLVAIARSVDVLHRRERVHADLAPGNLLILPAGGCAFDGLDIEAGTPATAATFEWAAPEQIVGHPLDPRTDVYALGRIAAALLGGVVFGEETHYVVPIGGDRSRRVQLLKAEGVFLDVSGTDRDRSWQRAWQDLLGRAVGFDRGRRPATAGQFADELAGVLERHPVTARLDLWPTFGDVVSVEGADGMTFAHVVID
ncbi:MAG: hypothetical protein IPQ07_25845 [Myxococcales bacterium]|nr:hypothetical protein [Myxococcales bacterium]